MAGNNMPALSDMDQDIRAARSHFAASFALPTAGFFVFAASFAGLPEA